MFMTVRGYFRRTIRFGYYRNPPSTGLIKLIQKIKFIQIPVNVNINVETEDPKIPINFVYFLNFLLHLIQDSMKKETFSLIYKIYNPAVH